MVEIALRRRLEEALEGDLLDTVRFTTPDDSGDFRVTLPRPGRYRLHARWAAASAELDFELSPAGSSVDLGEIVLDGGVRLIGSISGCAAAEAILFPMVDVTNPMTAAFSRTRRAHADVDGRFFVEGLQPGSWTIGFNCGGVITDVVPPVFEVPPGADVVIDFHPKPHP